MNNVVMQMLERYECKSLNDYENALKEIIQEIALLGLWRAKFFEVAAFYGGTSLRILRGLNRFSEDLDFSLLKTNHQFDISTYEDALKRELAAFGFDVTVEKKIKAMDTTIDSAFIKANTLTHLLQIKANLKTHKDAVLRVKLEVDTDPPGAYTTEAVSQFTPVPFTVLTFSLPTLLAGKITAMLFRPHKFNVKGRDWFDFLWYVSQITPVSLAHLEARMRQIKQWNHERELKLEDVKKILQQKVEEVDLDLIKKDVLPFVKDRALVLGWSKELLHDAVHRLKASET